LGRDCRTRESGYPVRRGLSVLPLTSLGYWIAAFAAMTVEYVSAFSRRVAPEVCKYLFAFSNQAQGMPDARCTRDPMRREHKKCAAPTR